MKKALIVLLGLLSVSAASAVDLRFFVGSTVSTYSSRWPSLYDEYTYQGSGLNPFRNYKAGVTFGLGFEFPVARNLKLDIDVHYSNRGADFKMWYISSGVDGFEEAHDLRGVSVPVLLKFSPLPRYFPYILAGGDVTFILTHRRESFLLYNYQSDEQWIGAGLEDFDPSTRKWDFGPVAGLGIEFPVSRGTFFLEARYRLGLTNLYRGAVDAKVMTRTLNIIAGFRYGASK